MFVYIVGVSPLNVDIITNNNKRKEEQIMKKINDSDVLYDNITNYGITIDGDGDLCLVDMNNNRVKLCNNQQMLTSFREVN